MIGESLGHYEIIGPLGAGGMGEVYRARDSKLRREVAIKVLPQELSEDEERLARLEREAHLLASLNHPNIATIFSLEEIEGTRFLVLELIDGESLQQRLERGPLRIAEALDICSQVARALEVAHQADIVHRDLKPANVLITRDERVKVVDFGIAKTLRPLGAADETAHATELTIAGTLVGTAPYMSPEQVRGEAVDKRSDVWAFGCLFFETLTGTAPFTRETLADTLAAIVGEEPRWEMLPEEASPAVRMLLHRCLQKSPKVRQRDIGDAWVEINQSLSHPGGVPMSMPPTIAAAAGPGLGRSAVAGLVIVALAVGAYAGWRLGPETAAPPVPLYLDFDPPEGVLLPTSAGPTLAISPDGTKIVVVGDGALGRQLFLHRLDQPGEPQPVPGTEGAGYPFFSPDGVMLAFDSPNGGIAAVSLVGGDAQTLCRECRRGAWGDDNSIIVQATADAAGSPWARISEPGASMEMLPRPSFEGVGLRPDRVDVLPGSRAVLFETGGAVYTFSFDTGEVTEVQKNASDPYYAGGYVLFPRDNTLYAVPFDAAALRVTGTPIVARQGVLTEPGGALHAAVSRDNGALVFVPGRTVTGFRLGWVDRTGAWEGIAADDEHIGLSPRVSPDGRRIAVGMASDPAGIYLLDENTKALDPFHIVDHVNISNINHAVWSRDGSSLTYREIRQVDRGGETRREQAIARKLVSGARAVETLFSVPAATAHSWTPASWTPDDERLIYGVSTESPRLLVAAPGAAERDSQLFESEFDTSAYTLSHDGNWLSYVSSRFGTDIVYVRPFPDGDEIRVSPAAGSEPRWGPDESELFYIAGNQLVSAKVRVVDGVFRVDSHEVLFDVSEYPGRTGVRARYDVHPDGNRFVMIRPNSIDDSHAINVVLNWFEEIKRLASEER